MAMPLSQSPCGFNFTSRRTYVMPLSTYRWDGSPLAAEDLSMHTQIQQDNLTFARNSITITHEEGKFFKKQWWETMHAS